jgi:Spy/CpxP family protein refolding chaperone
MHGMAGAEGHHGRMGHGGHDRYMGGGSMKGHMGGLSPRMLQSLQLSEAQRDKVNELMQAQAKSMQEQMGQHRARHEQLDQLSRAPSFDAAKARALADEQGQQMAQHLFQRVQLQSQLRALLTPEQLKQLDARQADGRPMDGKGPRPQPR